MPADPTTQQMGERHEKHLAEIFGGTKTRASGSQWTDPADGANHHDDPFAFRWDGKSTLGKSISVTRDMIAKLRQQAGGERPAFGLRWYGNAALTTVDEDWVVLRDMDFSELLEAAREAEELRTDVRLLREDLAASRAAETTLRMERDELARSAAAPGPDHRGRPEYVPVLPWTVVHKVNLSDRSAISGVHYAADGRVSTFGVNTVVVERSLGSGNRPRLIVNGRRVPDGDLYIDGRLEVRVWAAMPGEEKG